LDCSHCDSAQLRLLIQYSNNYTPQIEDITHHNAYPYKVWIYVDALHSPLSKVGDDGDSQGDDREYGTNVRHPSESKGYRRRLSWRIGVEILGSTK